MSAELSRREREDLQRLVRQRAKIAKAAATERAAALIADFEQQLDRRYSFDESEVWAAAVRAANEAAKAAQQRIAAECGRLGIPREFAPELSGPYWHSRGANAVKERRTELRRLARAQIEAAQKRACTEIERRSVEAQTELLALGLSEAARAFLAQIPSADDLMPALNVSQIERRLAGSSPALEAIKADDE